MAQTGQLHRDSESDFISDVAAATGADAVDHRPRLMKVIGSQTNCRDIICA